MHLHIYLQKRYIKQLPIFDLGRDANKQKKERGHNKRLLHLNSNHTFITNTNNWGFVEVDNFRKECFFMIEKLINA